MTAQAGNVRSIQDALHRIGWPIAVDGAPGPQTFNAVRDFQMGWAPWRLLIDGSPGPQTCTALNASIAYGGACGSGFFFREFASKGNHWIKVRRELVGGLVLYRQRYGVTVIVSGYRDPAHNHAVGGASNSQHLYGNAADLNPVASVNAVRNLRLFSGIGFNPKGLVRHVDVRHLGPNTTGGQPWAPTVWAYGN